MTRFVRALRAGGAAAALAVWVMSPAARADTPELALIHCWENTINGQWNAYCAVGGVTVLTWHCDRATSMECQAMKREWIETVCHTVRDSPVGTCYSV